MVCRVRSLAPFSLVQGDGLGAQAGKLTPSTAQTPLQLEFWVRQMHPCEGWKAEGAGALSCPCGLFLLVGTVMGTCSSILPPAVEGGKELCWTQQVDPASLRLTAGFADVVTWCGRQQCDFRCLDLDISCVFLTLVSPVGLLVPLLRQARWKLTGVTGQLTGFGSA